MSDFDTGNTAWVLMSAALVLFMTPGLAFFYGGMVRAKNIMSVLMHNYVTMAIAAIAWIACGYSLAFSDGPSWVGNLDFAGLERLGASVPGYDGDFAQSIPPLAFVAFQLMFAVITPALVTGAIAERMKFAPFAAFVAVWSLVVYAPVAHWIFSPVGWLFRQGALDFAGGAVVHINAGAAALALTIVLGQRRGWPRTGMPMHNLPFVMLGAGVLWFGWFGFNAGSALGANGLAATAFVNTNTAAAAALLAWIVTECLRGGRPTGVGGASGLVAGLVAITPAAGFVTPLGSILVGAVAGTLCCLGCSLKYRAGYDDALDVVGVHLIGGVCGALAIGFVSTTSVNPLGADGLLYGGGFALLGKQILAVVAVFAYSFFVTFAIAKVLDRTWGLRVSQEAEDGGLDLSVHGEVAYDFGHGEGTLGGAASPEHVAANRITSRELERTGHLS